MDAPCHDKNINDPIKNPEVTKSGGWNIQGGRFGKTRNSGKTMHDGFDAKSKRNTPFTPILSGEVVNIDDDFYPDQYKKYSYGNYIIVKSILSDGNEVYIKYNHLNRVDVLVGQDVSTNDIIGLSGTSGNASSKKTKVIPHIHVQCRPINNFRFKSWERYNTTKNSFNNPEKYIEQKFKDNGKRENPCD